MEEAPGSSPSPSWILFLRENRWGRTAFLLTLVVLSSWVGWAVLTLRDAIVGAGETAGSDSLRNSFNVDGLANLGGTVASSISRDWWEILASLLILGMAVAAVRFLDGLRPRAALGELGLRGGLRRSRRWLLVIPFLPPLAWLGYAMYTTEPRLLTESFTWKSYFFPWADQDGTVFALFREGHSARPVWWLKAGAGALAGGLFTYGLVWPQLRRLGFDFLAVLGLILGAELLVIVIDVVRFPGNGLLTDFPGGTFLYFSGICFTAATLALSGWIVERWGGRAWVPAVALFSVQLPDLLAYPHYVVGTYQSYDDNDLWLMWAGSMIYALGPLVLLAVLTGLTPRLALPSISERKTECTSSSPS